MANITVFIALLNGIHFFFPREEGRLVAYHRLVCVRQTAMSVKLVPNTTQHKYMGHTMLISRDRTPASQSVNWKVSGSKMALDMLSHSYPWSGRWWLLRKEVSWSRNARMAFITLGCGFLINLSQTDLLVCTFPGVIIPIIIDSCLHHIPPLPPSCEWQVSVRGQKQSWCKQAWCKHVQLRVWTVHLLSALISMEWESESILLLSLL